MFFSTLCSQVFIVFGFYARSGFSQNDRVIFPADDDFSEMNSVMQGARIPESLLIQMKDVRNTSEFLSRFVADYERPELDTSGITGRRGLASPPAFTIADFATCRPEPHVVELEKPESGAVLLWPQCVRVPRCGGCCTSKMLACRPVATSIINVTVLQVRYSPQSGEAFESDGPRVVSLEQHDRCACECNVRPADCRPGLQVYREDECRCVCGNQDQAANCTGSRRIWDPEDCICKCRRTQVCSSGLYFNPISCRCETLRRSRNNANSRQESLSNSSTANIQVQR